MSFEAIPTVESSENIDNKVKEARERVNSKDRKSEERVQQLIREGKIEEMHQEMRNAEASDNAEFSYLALTNKQEQLREAMERTSRDRRVAIPNPGHVTMNKLVYNKETNRDMWESAISFGGGSFSIDKAIRKPNEWLDEAANLLKMDKICARKGPSKCS